ncbi:MAG: hypothetical protein IIY95_05555, partial [Firmicutes bacterium]|nr:hypothetical protein [Bacillota bacterium]
QIAVKELRAAGAVPIIAADPVEERRKLALASGADYAEGILFFLFIVFLLLLNLVILRAVSNTKIDY